MHAWIREQRVAAGLTQADVAASLGMTQTNISRVEGGQIRISVDLLRRLATIIGFDPADALRADAPQHGEAA